MKELNEKEFTNSLSAVIGGILRGGYGLGTAWGSTMVSQVDTFFKNNRWYLISNIRQVLSEIYVEHGIVQTLVDLPVDDGFRGGIEIKSEQLDEDQVDELENFIEREGILRAFIQALKWTRLFGGGAVLILTDSSNPAKELKPEELKEKAKITFKAVDLWELYYGMTNTDYFDPGQVMKEPEFYNYYGYRVHKSRVIRMEGKQAPSLIRPKLRGWGTSVLETVVRSYNQYLKSVNLAFEVLDEFKVDIFKIDGLNSALMSPNGTENIQKRLQMANMQKNYLSSIGMDTKDDFLTKQLSFSGLGEIMREIRMQIAADLRMPLTKLFGMSASGFNSGEDDIENYNAMIETEIRSKVKYDLIKMLQICSQILFGYIPDDICVEFKPLRILSAEQQEVVKNNQLQRITSCMQGGLMSVVEAKKAINKENLLPIKLDENDELIELPEQNMEELSESVPSISLKVREKSNSLSLWERLKKNWSK